MLLQNVQQVNQRQHWKLRLKFNGGHSKKITVHLLNLLFVTAVGISLLLGTTALSPVFSLQQAQNSTSCD